MTDQEMAAADPFALFQDWMHEAERSEPNDPNAVALATTTPDGHPSVRMVLMKRTTDDGFCFFTNEGSQKGQELHANPRAAMCFHWKSLRRQVRIEGTITELPRPEVEQYFHSRSRRSQLGAAVSEQSRPLPSRDVLLGKVQQFAETHPGAVPLPDYWRGYCLRANRIEFWIDGKDRLHDRFRFAREVHGWQVTRLYP